MTPDERADAYLDRILRASGSRLAYFEDYTKDTMRKVMHEIMSAEYIAGSRANDKAWRYLEAERAK